ncbi:MAG: WG repeat-containing protein [Clostridiales bacterium]|nr:WG repeat-containing protein [Clostridiales bacterium]
MKRVISIILCLILFGTAACGCSGGSSSLSADGSAADSSDNAAELQTSSEESDNTQSEIGFTTPYEIIECLSGYFIATSNDGKLYGMLDSNGNTVIDFEYDELSFGSQDKAEYVSAYLEGKYGTLDLNGNVMVPLEYAQALDFESYLNYTDAVKDGDNYIVSKDGSTVITPALDSNYLNVLSDNCYYATKLEDTGSIGGFYDMEGNLLLGDVREYRPKSVDGNYILWGEYTWDTSGRIASTQIELYDASMNYIADIGEVGGIIAATLSANLTVVTNDVGLFKGSTYYLINCSDGSVCSDSYEDAEVYDEKVYGYSTDGGNLCMVDSDGTVLKTYESGMKIIARNIIKKTSGDTTRLYDVEGNELFDERFYDVEDFNNGCVMVENVDNNYALISPDGDVLVDFGSFTEDSIYGNAIKTQLFANDMYCAVTSNSNSENEVHAFVF